MEKCSAITGSTCPLHEMEMHVECPARLAAAISGVPSWVDSITVSPADEADIERIHPPRYIRMIRDLSALGGKRYVDPDTYITAETYGAALEAAGASIEAVNQALSGIPSFALIRPPGHHAEPEQAMGYCIFNNVAIATAHALTRIARVAIIDWDLHHGNGTQKAFYSDDNVLFCSIHQVNTFPRTGWVDEIGAGHGKGYTLNAPVREGSELSDYLYVFDEVFLPEIRRYAPDLVLISAGFDPMYDDPVGGVRLHPADFGILTTRVRSVLRKPVALVLEGGYGPSIGLAVNSVFEVLGGAAADVPAYTPHENTKKVVAQLKKLIT